MIFYTGSASAPVTVGVVKNGQQRVSVRQDGVSHSLLSTPEKTDEFLRQRTSIEKKRNMFNKVAAVGLTLAGGVIGFVNGGGSKVKKSVATGVGAVVGLLVSTATATVSTLVANYHQNNLTGKFIEQNK